MDCALLCNMSVPEICAEDIKELVNKECSIKPGVCIAKDVTVNDIATLTYFCQSTYRVVPLFRTITTSAFSQEKIDVETLKKDLNANTQPFSAIEKELIENSKHFALRITKRVNTTTTSPEIERTVGAWYQEKAKEIKALDVNLNKPDLPIHGILTEDEIYIGVDVTGVDLSKRPYKILPYKTSINGVIAYTIAKLSGLKKNHTILDPFCGSGTIIIEAALYQQGISPFALNQTFTGSTLKPFKQAFQTVKRTTGSTTKETSAQITGYDTQFNIMNQARKHAKLARVKEHTTISKVDVDWIDMKFDKDSIDLIITNPPQVSKKLHNEKEIAKIYDEFCYQIHHLLKPEGQSGVLLKHTSLFEDSCTRHDLQIIKKQPILNGDETLNLLLLKKNTKQPKEWI
ncbi:MAG: THUMP domain-containing protein [Nanobdellota archaeon]